MKSFRNHPLLELRRPQSRERLLAALADLDRELPFEVPAVVAGRRSGSGPLSSVDPCRPERIVARWAEAEEEEIAAALDAAAHSEWPRLAVGDRAAALERAAERLDRDRARLAALILREAGKPWAEADAEVCEAIDFLRLYAEAAPELGEELEQAPGERNELRCVPRGPAAVISPWNFPISIPCGMCAAALVMGSAVLFKPAEQTPATGAALVGALHGAGVPADALHLVPGAAAVGRRLVEAPEVATIAFTGSVAVGLEIHRLAFAGPAASGLKRVVAELGGKNCIIVDADADLDVAVPELVRSAYAYAGQKCSAAGRVIADERILPQLRERLAGAVELLAVGPAESFDTDVPALIDDAAVAKHRRYADLCRGHELAGAPAARGPRFVEPLLAAGLPAGSPVLAEEVFGPLLTLESAPDLLGAARRVSELPQALTAGILSRHPERVESAIAQLRAGNVYVNRRITGAVVGRQPFGGNGISGTGARAGGRRYLWQFTDDQVVCENTLRHGLELS